VKAINPPLPIGVGSGVGVSVGVFVGVLVFVGAAVGVGSGVFVATNAGCTLSSVAVNGIAVVVGVNDGRVQADIITTPSRTVNALIAITLMDTPPQVPELRD
jgi:hypothetical protein